MYVDAVIFDIGGVLRPPTGPADKEYFKSYIFTHYNEKLTNTILNGCDGRPLREQVKCWEKELNIAIDSIDYDQFDKDTTEKQLEMIRGEEKDSEMTKFLKYLNKNNIPIGIGTSSGRARAEKILEILDVPYNVLVTSDDVTDGKSKPAPDIYLSVVKNLKYPKRVLVVENSYLGITAAKRASHHLGDGITLKVIAYRKYDLEHKEELSKADAIVDDFSEIYAYIDQRFPENI
ncbi:MAG: HAD hydrolase-like protein [archaeon]|nr:HAD hydrolase-like protein [archaeon]